jgi:hypothetical protein
VPRRYRRQHGRLSVWAAWIRHLAGTLALAPRRGHPAHLYQQRTALAYWVVTSPGRDVRELREKEAPGLEALEAFAARAGGLYAELCETLLGPTPATERAKSAIAAAERLVEMTERRV